MTVEDFSGKNMVLIITDQVRQMQNFPPGWSEKNLPGLTRLQKTGVSFTQATCNAAMCTPSRATMLTGYLPGQHGVRYTVEGNMPSDQYPQVELPLPDQIANVAQLAVAAGYQAVYKGKFHLMKAAGPDDTFTPEQMVRYGFTRWNPPVREREIMMIVSCTISSMR